MVLACVDGDENRACGACRCEGKPECWGGELRDFWYGDSLRHAAQNERSYTSTLKRDVVGFHPGCPQWCRAQSGGHGVLSLQKLWMKHSLCPPCFYPSLHLYPLWQRWKTCFLVGWYSQPMTGNNVSFLHSSLKKGLAVYLNL